MKKKLLLVLFFLIPSLAFAYKSVTANVMAPLNIETYNNPCTLEESDWDTFRTRLTDMKKVGANAVSTDIWWGLVEAEGDADFPQKKDMFKFDWSYYLRIAKEIKESGLHWVPILSFHQCGGNVGDDCNILVPKWVWTKLILENKEITSPKDAEFVSANGSASKEYVAFWADKYILPEYEELMSSFKDTFKEYIPIIDEINIALGPSGELRYPSYNAHDGGGYPKRGELQAYSNTAIEDFRGSMFNKYGSLTNLNKAWGTNLKSISEINPPNNSSFFFEHGDYMKTQYGRDLIDWYNSSLANHAVRVLSSANRVFGDEYANIPLGFKMPGVHWRVADPIMPRVAEVTAGLIPSYDNKYEKGYTHTLSIIANGVKDFKNRLMFHFTCLEMDNGNNEYPYQRPKDLVFWVSKSAQAVGLPIKGENALSGGVHSNEGWNNIENAIDYSSYSGVTILRLDDVDTDQTAHKRFEEFVKKYSK